MARTIEALKVCADKIAAQRVARARCVATEACRRAANCAEFSARVARETGIELEIITTSEEARLAVAGCAPLLDPRMPRALVFDIGGGSTEIVWLRLELADGAAADGRASSARFAAVWRRHPDRSLWRREVSRGDLSRRWSPRSMARCAVRARARHAGAHRRGRGADARHARAR